MRRRTRLLALLMPICLSLTAAWAKSPEEFLGETPAVAPTPAVSPKSSKGRDPRPLDTAKIHEMYLEGDFDLATRALEKQMISKRHMSHAESVFVFKHLGVMYAASEISREKGREYMQKLISIEPTAKILDMYASDMIYLIFRNVQEEFESKRARLQPRPETTAVVAASASAPASVPAPKPPAGQTPQPSSRNRRTFYMAAAGVGVAVGAFALFMFLSEDEPKARTIVITE